MEEAAGEEAASTIPAVDAAPVLDPLTPERVADRLLSRLREASPSQVFDWPDPHSVEGNGDAALDARKAAADLLVKAKLARFADDTRTEIEISNAGRYWALHGGYLAYLKEEPPAAGGGRQRNPEMENLRAEYMKLRLDTFWWSFGLSVAGFVMSIISVIIAVVFGERLLR